MFQLQGPPTTNVCNREVLREHPIYGIVPVEASVEVGNERAVVGSLPIILEVEVSSQNAMFGGVLTAASFPLCVFAPVPLLPFARLAEMTFSVTVFLTFTLPPLTLRINELHDSLARSLSGSHQKLKNKIYEIG